MSIINLDKTFENNQFVYCNLNNNIIECLCLSKLYKYIIVDYDNEDFGKFICNKVKIITIYDIYKNIISEPIQTDIFKDPIKSGVILKKIKRKKICFFKTFLGAFIIKNKLNDIRYYISCTGNMYGFLYNNISLKVTKYNKKIYNIYDNEGDIIHTFNIYKDFIIYFKNNDKNNYIKIIISNNYIKIIKHTYLFKQIKQIITFHKESLEVYKIEEYSKFIKLYEDERDDNNKIIMIKEYDNFGKLKKNFVSNNDISPFLKPLKKSCIELINNYKENINKQRLYIIEKEKEVKELLLNYK